MGGEQKRKNEELECIISFFLIKVKSWFFLKKIKKFLKKGIDFLKNIAYNDKCKEELNSKRKEVKK